MYMALEPVVVVPALVWSTRDPLTGSRVRGYRVGMRDLAARLIYALARGFWWLANATACGQSSDREPGARDQSASSPRSIRASPSSSTI